MKKETGLSGARLKDFHELSLKLIGLADKGRLISDYYREISTVLLHFSGAHYLSFLTSDANNYYRLSFYPDKERSSRFQDDFNSSPDLPTNIKNIDTIELKGLGVEALENIVYSGRPLSNWTAIEGGGIKISETAELDLTTDYASLLILPVKTEEQTVGAISFGWDKKTEIEQQEVELYQYVAGIIGFARTHRRAKFLLGERIKELKTIYKISRLGTEIGKSLDDILNDAVEIIPPGFLHSEAACCRILYANKEFKSKNYKTPIYNLKEDIVSGNVVKGSVEVSYTRELSSISKEPFLKEEQPMLRAIAGELGHVAERKHFEEERERLQQQLLHADRLVTVGQLTAGVAHELNEPLNGILGFAQLIKKDGKINLAVEKDIDKIIKASLHGREIIRKLMLFSRQAAPEKMMVNINEKIIDGLYLLESRINKSNITLVKDLAPDLPMIKIDPSQLNQVMVNLVVNAIQAMPHGGRLTIKTGSSINAICIMVEDTGIGMTAEQADKIFIPFYTTKDINEGVGLGLPVALGIVQSHQGSIDVKSKPGEGTMFTVKFPIKGDNNGD